MTAAIDPQKLANLYPALASLPAGQLAALLPPGAIMQLPAGTQVFAEHQPCQGFPLVLEGSIKVIKLAANGRELMLYRVMPGGSCIISSSCLLGHSDYNARGIAETPLTLLALLALVVGVVGSRLLWRSRPALGPNAPAAGVPETMLRYVLKTARLTLEFRGL